jgi:hypothetical protein
MNDPRTRRDAGLAAVARWTRGAVAGGVLLAGVLGAGLAHLLPGQASDVRHATPAPVTSAPPDVSASPRDGDGSPRSLAPPSASPHRGHGHPHATSGGS